MGTWMIIFQFTRNGFNYESDLETSRTCNEEKRDRPSCHLPHVIVDIIPALTVFKQLTCNNRETSYVRFVMGFRKNIFRYLPVCVTRHKPLTVHTVVLFFYSYLFVHSTRICDLSPLHSNSRTMRSFSIFATCLRLCFWSCTISKSFSWSQAENNTKIDSHVTRIGNRIIISCMAGSRSRFPYTMILR